jgi:hypothetical protein
VTEKSTASNIAGKKKIKKKTVKARPTEGDGHLRRA